jgi:hypothetical protein
MTLSQIARGDEGNESGEMKYKKSPPSCQGDKRHACAIIALPY